MKSQENWVIEIDTKTYLAWLSCKKNNNKVTHSNYNFKRHLQIEMENKYFLIIASFLWYNIPEMELFDSESKYAVERQN